MTMQDRELYQGETVSWAGSFVDIDDNPINFNEGDREGVLRITPQSQNRVLITKSTNNAEDWSWTDKDNGLGVWLFTSEQAEDLWLKRNRADCIYYDRATVPITRHVVGEGTYIVRMGPAGPIFEEVTP